MFRSQGGFLRSVVGELFKQQRACGNVAQRLGETDRVFRGYPSTDEDAPLLSRAASAENEESVFVSSGTAKEHLNPDNSDAQTRRDCFYQLEINKRIKV